MSYDRDAGPFQGMGLVHRLADQLPKHCLARDKLKSAVIKLCRCNPHSKTADKIAATIKHVQQKAHLIGENLAEDMLSLDMVMNLSNEDRSIRKRVLMRLERLSQDIDTLKFDLEILHDRVAVKSSADEAELHSPQICVRLALSIGAVLDTILVHLPRQQHFGAVISLTRAGGEHPSVRDVRRVQDELCRRRFTPEAELPETRSSPWSVRTDVTTLIHWLFDALNILNLPPTTLFDACLLCDRYMMGASNHSSRPTPSMMAAFLLAYKLGDTQRTGESGTRLTQAVLEGQLGIQRSTCLPSPPARRVPRPAVHGKGHRKGALGQPGGRHRGREHRVPHK
mmetsp:Transcript_15622/g.32553  ORF Transcript_15622/g.32553 Transcript_15622/m.32553 type:complete len:339 (+) Transcript_15622:1-1017(+)